MEARSTAVQRRIGKKLGLDLSACSMSMAAAHIREVVAEAIGEPRAAWPSTERQRAFAEALGFNVEHTSVVVASATIGEALFERNRKALRKLRLKPGDRVLKRTHFEFDGELRELATEAIVSSIQPNLRVYFKGGNGQGAWPSELEVLTRAAENGAAPTPNVRYGGR
jgi:hypothetical protein